MTLSEPPALLEALALHRTPRARRPRADEPLPEGMSHLIRLAAGEESAFLAARGIAGETGETLREAARFYVQQVMFAPTSDSFRVLGVNRDADEPILREHYRWLVRWLHPDRNPDEWEALYADRVNQAWQDLRTPERRLQYESRLKQLNQEEPDSMRPVAIGPGRPRFDAEPGAGLDLRWLPTAILGTLGVSALGFVILFSALQWAERSDPQNVSVTTPSTPLGTGESATALRAPRQQPAQSREIAPASATRVEAAPIPPVAAPPIQPALPVLTKAPDPAPPAFVSNPVTTPKPVAARLPVLAGPEPRPVAARMPVSAGPEPKPVVASAAPRSAPIVPPAMTAEPVAPVPAARRTPEVPVASSAPEPAAIGAQDANRLLGNFARAYGAGDLSGLEAMFTADVSGSEGNLKRILAGYDKVFQTSERRSLAVHDVSWFENDGTLTIIASYQATVEGTRGPRKSRGDLRMDLRKVKGQWRIFRFQQGERPG